MKISLLMLICSLALLATHGCSTPKPLPRVATVELHDTAPITLMRSSLDSQQLFAIVTPASNSSTYSRAILLLTRTNGVHDSIMMSTEASGAAKEPRTTILRCRIPGKHSAEFASYSLSVGLEQGNIITFHPAQLQAASDEAITMTPFVRYADNGIVTFGTTCLRNKLVEGEYLPSSEELRVSVRSGFKVLWNSNQGMAFLTMIMPVRPEAIGQQSTYTLEWDGQDNSGTPIPAGEYTADILIPAKPAPYLTQINFTWPLSKK